MKIRTVTGIHEIPATQWNRLAGHDDPFVRHELIAAFEQSGCATPATGWTAQHLAVFDGGELLAATPLYAKTHTYGEFVFDFAWAEAYRRAGLDYYPKLASAIPFSPVTGCRLLVGGADENRRMTLQDMLINGALEHARTTGVSSLHWLFPNDTDSKALARHGLLPRQGVQYHWFNPGYRDFEDFLSMLTADKRKKIRRERRYVREAGVTIEVREGRDITAAHWDIVHDFHQATIANYGAPPFLTREFFYRVGEALPEHTVVLLARLGREYVGATFNLRGAEALFGRYWGGQPGYHSLHFEVCYYSAIDYCIARGLKRFEGGAGGEHKLARGFVPVPTASTHWLRHPQFARAVADYLARERHGVAHYIDELNERTPFKRVAN